MSHQCACGEPIADTAVIGARCVSQLMQDLAEIPALSDELDTILSRQTAGGERVGGRSPEKPLPYDVGASLALSDLRAKLVSWVQALRRPLRTSPQPEGPLCGRYTDGQVCEHESCPAIFYGGRTYGDHWPADNVPSMSRWLLSRVVRIAHHEAGNDAAEEIRDAVRTGQRCLSRGMPQEGFTAGRCGAYLPDVDRECVETLFASLGATQVACRACGATHDMRERREWMRSVVIDRLYPTSQVAHVIVLWRAPVTPSVIAGLVHRKKLEPADMDTSKGRPIPLYRVGDVLAALTEQDKRKAAA